MVLIQQYQQEMNLIVDRMIKKVEQLPDETIRWKPSAEEWLKASKGEFSQVKV